MFKQKRNMVKGFWVSTESLCELVSHKTKLRGHLGRKQETKSCFRTGLVLIAILSLTSIEAAWEIADTIRAVCQMSLLALQLTLTPEIWLTMSWGHRARGGLPSQSSKKGAGIKAPSILAFPSSYLSFLFSMPHWPGEKVWKKDDNLPFSFPLSPLPS